MLEARKLGRKVGEDHFYLWGVGSEKKGRPKQVFSYRAGDAISALHLRSSRKGVHLPSAYLLPWEDLPLGYQGVPARFGSGKT